MDEQNYTNHARTDAPYHYFAIPVVLVAFVAALVHVVLWPSWHSLAALLVAAAVVVLAFKIRLYALKVQDRVIRLEERLRLATLLPEPLRVRIGELSEAQLIALRFASDAELPALAGRAMNEKLDAKQIKQSIQNWRADNWRV